VQHVFLNGTEEVAIKDGVYTADFIDFYESYDVIYLPATLQYLMDNAGLTNPDGTPYLNNNSYHIEELNESYLTYTITHRFHKNGSYTVYQEVKAARYIESVSHFGVMAMPFSGDNYIYTPGSTNYALPTLHPKAAVYAEGGPLLRSFYLLSTPDGAKGMNVGYYPYSGIATDEKRPEAIAGFGGTVANWYTGGKMYPHLFKKDHMDAGESYEFIGYHVPTVKIDDDFFAVNWYFVGDEIYLSFHTDKAVDEKTVALPNSDYLTGLAVTVIEASDSFAVYSATVDEDGIRVSTDGAGYCTVKLTKEN
jgi:hypothetical protein